jgi:hypothetical protein
METATVYRRGMRTGVICWCDRDLARSGEIVFHKVSTQNALAKFVRKASCCPRLKQDIWLVGGTRIDWIEGFGKLRSAGRQQVRKKKCAVWCLESRVRRIGPLGVNLFECQLVTPQPLIPAAPHTLHMSTLPALHGRSALHNMCSSCPSSSSRSSWAAIQLGAKAT